MFSSLIVIAAIVALIYASKRWSSLPEEERASFAKKALLYGGSAAILGLVVAGRAHWLMGVLAGLLAVAGRAAQFAQYVPMFKKVFGEEGGGNNSSGRNNSGQSPISQLNMSQQDAADILGVEPNASAEEIRAAHKKLMQKMHPDRGGSQALAKQINLAKDILLQA